MNYNKKALSLFYVDKNKGYFYSRSMTSILQLDLPTDVINDLEVINEDKLNLLLQTFIVNNKIMPTGIIILLSTALTFEKDLPESPSDQLEKETSKFLELVPFENVLSKITKIDKKWKIVAANNQLCENFKIAFEKQNFFVVGIVPLAILCEVLPELSQNLDLNIVLDKIDTLYSLLPPEEIIRNTGSKGKNQQQSKITLILIIIFLILTAVMGILIFNNALSETTQNKVKKSTILITPSKSQPASIVTPTPFPLENYQLGISSVIFSVLPISFCNSSSNVFCNSFL